MEVKEQASSTFGCTNCGADLKFVPGTTELRCDYCGTTNHIEPLDDEIEEFDFLAHLSKAGSADAQEQLSLYVVKCGNCGSTSSLDKDLKSAHCAYCSNALIIEDGHIEHFLKPKSLLPFKLDRQQALAASRKWIRKLWFAPNALKKVGLKADVLKGIYMPFWTYDTDTFTKYTGQRGEHYWVSETYATVENGKTVTKTRRVRKTRWYFASGSVSHFFDDELVAASESMPRKYVNRLEPWDLQNLTPFNEKFLSGFTTEKYQTDLKTGFEIAKLQLSPRIDALIRRDIGGDEQRILSKRTHYDRITFKHLLLPAYISAFRFQKKVYRFIVNARTGEVHGERPWSIWKIVLTILTVIILLALCYILFTEEGREIRLRLGIG